MVAVTVAVGSRRSTVGSWRRGEPFPSLQRLLNRI
jgi:hypothetical protein